ncbi:glycoside hydrolase family 15 protein [Aestuariimicrobium sp. Y1814]|uniref:glycoside hydrolase family 15 protein n=1 Tax=Aestuariimicrobium sp. Y1814 TaxID=3418742 RepID=UPI003DA6F242
MDTPLEKYALLSDQHSAALVSEQGSIDWLCLPRFDSQAVFTAILGGEDAGHWTLEAVDGEVVDRRYVGDSFVLQTTWRTPTGQVTVTDYMPVAAPDQPTRHDLMRSVRCDAGHLVVRNVLRIRFSYGEAVPYFRNVTDGDACEILAVAGPDSLLLRGPLLEQRDDVHVGEFELTAGDELHWDLSWSPSFHEYPEVLEPVTGMEATIAAWNDWASAIDVRGPYAEQVRRSLLTLRALTDEVTGGIVAAPTTSLPEEFGGSRNWDYRYVWLRDSALTIEALLAHGFTDGANRWRHWLLRAIAGDPNKLRIMYGLGGERHLPEFELDHLPGYENSTPVRIGNGAAGQYQADVVGEVMVALHTLREAGVAEDEFSWGLQKSMLDFQEANLERRDHGIWEMRGDLHHFTHSRAMMWAAFDRGVRAVEEYGLDGPVERWRELRDRMRAEVLERGFNEQLQSFTQTYENTEVDASLLQLPQVGLLAHDDPRMLSTVARIEADLLDEHGFVHRYRTAAGTDGLPGDEYSFLICAFWLVEQYARSGRLLDACAMMDRLVGVSTDLGLLAEEYSPVYGRLAGNFPQAFSHLGLIRAADALDEVLG